MPLHRDQSGLCGAARLTDDALRRATVRPAGQRRLVWAIVARPELLIDGQHRLAAVVQSGVTVQMWVIVGSAFTPWQHGQAGRTTLVAPTSTSSSTNRRMAGVGAS